MANFAFTDCYLLFGATNMSPMTKKATIKTSAAELDNTAFGGPGWRSRIGGLKDWSVDVEFNQDEAAAQVDVTVFPLLGTTFTVEIRPTSAARSTVNPAYVGTALLKEYTPLDGTVGDLAKGIAALVGAGQLQRLTA